MTFTITLNWHSFFSFVGWIWFLLPFLYILGFIIGFVVDKFNPQDRGTFTILAALWPLWIVGWIISKFNRD